MLSSETTKRFFKNKVALVSFAFILLSSLVSIMAYLIIPENSPNANLQIPDLSLKSAGSTSLILLKRKNREIEEKGFIYKTFNGFESKFNHIPIKSHQFLDDTSIEVVKANGQKSIFDLKDIVYNTNADFPEVEDLKAKVLERHIVKKHFIFGTDKFGRDVLSRLILGIRISLMVGLIAVIISLLVGIVLGALAGYFGGMIDKAIMFLVNTVWSIPTLLLVFAIILAFGKGVGIIFIAVGLTMWVEVARIVRGQVLNVKEQTFIQAAKAMGFNSGRIIQKHILPNIIGPILVIAAANFATAILIEAGLSYLGFGIQPPTPSIGTMLNENYGYVFSGKVVLAIAPAVMIMLLVLAFNLVGTGLRDAFDIRKNLR